MKFKKCCIDNVRVLTFSVQHKAFPDFHCEIQLTDDDTLHDLHGMIQSAFRWDNDHMYSFMMDNKYRRSKAEYSANPLGEGDTDIPLERLGLNRGRKFLYLFDYGDQHLFDVRVKAVRSEKGGSPSIERGYERFGRPPEQYELPPDALL